MADSYQYPREVFARAFRGTGNDAMRELHLQIIESVFFASMMQEEGEFVPIAIVVDHDHKLEEITDSDPNPYQEGDERAWIVWRTKAIPLTAKNLKRFAHGVEYGRDLVVVARENDNLVMNGIARRRPFTDGGEALRIAAPRPGVIVLEGLNRQLGVRYDVGRETPRDVEVFDEEGPVRSALKQCDLEGQRWRLAEVLRQARAAHCGGMFLCLPDANATTLGGTLNYEFADPDVVPRLAKAEWDLVARRIATARADGNYSAQQLEEHLAANEEADNNKERLVAGVEMLGRLAANDGAVIIEPGFRVFGAGFIIDIKDDNTTALPPAPWACSDAAGEQREPSVRGGGARHKAGLRFAWANEGAVVFIVSADGPVTCGLRVGGDLLTWAVRLPET